MGNGAWGHCRTCKFFASPASVPLGGEEARCEQPQLAKLALTVFGASGCNAWELRAGLSPQTEQPPATRGNGTRRPAAGQRSARSTRTRT